MKATPVNDFFAKDGTHRARRPAPPRDVPRPVKAPAESKYPWDYYKIVKTIPAAEAFPSVEQQACPLVKK